MNKRQVPDVLRKREASLTRWRQAGLALRYRRHAGPYLRELKAWKAECEAPGAHRVLAWGARELWLSAQEYLRRDYNAYRCRLRRFNNALDRWETSNVCPVEQPTRYTRAALTAEGEGAQ